MKEITNEKMQELMENQEFAAKVRSAKTAEEMVKIFAEYNVQITEDELREQCEQTVAILREQGYMDGDELTESGLELVSGGADGFGMWAGTVIGGAGLVIGMTIAPVAGGIILGCGAVGLICGMLTPKKKRR